MIIKEIKIDDLLPSEYNPRKELTPEDEEYKNIKKSIEKFGYVEPIIVNVDNTVIGGHQRLNVLKELNYEKISCVVVDVNKNEEKALNIALNKIDGIWDDDKLIEIFENLNNTELIDFTGFSKKEIDNYLKETDIDSFFTGEDVEKKEDKKNEKQCPECVILINTKEWKVIE